jgi:hypothetical protein
MFRARLDQRLDCQTRKAARIACDTHQGLMDIIKRKIDQKALEVSRDTMIG